MWKFKPKITFILNIHINKKIKDLLFKEKWNTEHIRIKSTLLNTVSIHLSSLIEISFRWHLVGHTTRHDTQPLCLPSMSGWTTFECRLSGRLLMIRHTILTRLVYVSYGTLGPLPHGLFRKTTMSR